MADSPSQVQGYQPPRLLLFVVGIPILVGFLAFFTARAFSPNPPSHPVVEYTTQLDLGEQSVGTTAKGQFTIRNRGNRELVVDQFRSDCSCSGIEREENGQSVPVSSLLLQPGEHADLSLHLSVRGVPTGEGMKSRLAFRTNDPNHPFGSVEASVSRVTGGAHARPATVALPSVPIGGQVRVSLNVYDRSRRPRKISQVTLTDSEQVKARIVQINEKAEGKRLGEYGTLIGHVEILVEGRKQGPINEVLQIHLDDGSVECPPIPIVGRVVTPIEFLPAVLTLPRRTSTGSVYSAKVMCRSHKSEPLKLTVKSLPPGFAAEVLSDEDKATQIVLITCDPMRKQEKSKGLIRFRAESGGETSEPVLQVHLQP